MIIVNAVNLASGGGYTILENFYRWSPRLSCFLVKDNIIKNKLESTIPGGPELYVVPAILTKHFFIFYFYFFWVNKFCRGKKAVRLVSLGNIGARTNIPQIIYIHWAYYAYGIDSGGSSDKKTAIKRIIRYIFIKLFSKYSSDWVVQTNTIKRQLEIRYGAKVHNIIRVVTPGVDSYCNVNHSTKSNQLPKLIRLLYPSLYYSHKNFQILLKLAREIQNIGLPYRLSLTLPHNDFISLGFCKYNCVINLGVLERQELYSQYKKHDALIMPTKLETFGLPYLEAMAFGLPIVTSDKEFSREICGDYAIYFDPDDVNSILRALENLRSDMLQLRNFAIESLEQISKFPSWQQSVEAVFFKEKYFS